MPRQDTVDFLTAFAVGTVLGIGATLLLQPQRSPKERVVHQLKPYRKQIRRGYKKVRSGMSEGAGATAEFGGEVISAGRELLSEFRAEVAGILSEAREELQEMLPGQQTGLQKRIKRARRRLGM